MKGRGHIRLCCGGPFVYVVTRLNIPNPITLGVSLFMTAADLGSWTATGATVISTVYIVLGYYRNKTSAHSKTSGHPLLWIIIPLVVASWLAVAFDYYDRHINCALSCDKLVLAWGRVERVFYMAIDSRFLLDYKDKYKVMLILNAPYINVDKMIR
jgi:hypothetical protein